MIDYDGSDGQSSCLETVSVRCSGFICSWCLRFLIFDWARSGYGVFFRVYNIRLLTSQEMGIHNHIIISMFAFLVSPSIHYSVGYVYTSGHVKRTISPPFPKYSH